MGTIMLVLFAIAAWEFANGILNEQVVRRAFQMDCTQKRPQRGKGRENRPPTGVEPSWHAFLPREWKRRYSSTSLDQAHRLLDPFRDSQRRFARGRPDERPDNMT